MVINRFFRLRVGVAVLASLLVLGGCQSTPSNDGVVVAPMAVGHPTALDAYHVAVAMREAGFADAQILALGADLRNAIARAGGAKVLTGHATEALLAVDGHHLHVTSRRGTTRTYDLLERRPEGASAARDRAAPREPGTRSTP